LTSQPLVVGNETVPRTALSKDDSFRLQIPSGWIIQDMNNTGAALGVEVLQGYGILAQLCPVEEQEGMHANSDVGENGTISTANISTGNFCQGAQEEVIHIVRYPNLSARLALTNDDIASSPDRISDTILAYQMQKLIEAGYRDIRIVNSTDTKVNVDLTTALNNNTVAARVPAKLVEMTYSTDLVPNETRRGYFISTATDVTSRNLETITGYGLFYEGPILNDATPEQEGQKVMMQTGSLVLAPLTPISQVFGSFELIAVPEVVQSILSTQAEQQIEEVQATQEEMVDPLTVNIDSNGTEGASPVAFEFEADITGGTEPYTIMWDLDDDGVAESNEQTFVGTFSEAGTYDGELTVMDIRGQIASDTIEITIEEGEEAPIEDESLEDETMEGQSSCDSAYPSTCIPSPPPILSCDDIGASNFEVRSPDPHEFDDDNDGTGCENENTQQPELDNEPVNPESSDSQGIGGIINRTIEGFSNSSLL